MRPFPVFLVRQEYREGLMDWLSSKTAGSDYVDLAGLDLMEIVDDPAEVVVKADR
jgi:predicted Rossmann-fold nucleotide-binding protein